MSNTPSNTHSWVTFSAVLGGFAIFALIVTIAYLPQRPAPVQQGALTPKERMIRLMEMRGKEQRQLGSYAWIDQQKGTVQLPIERAMELTIQERRPKK
jgi:hypothetical protein